MHVHALTNAGLEFRTTTTRYAQQTERSVIVIPAQFGAVSGTWLLDLLRAASDSTSITPMQHSELMVVLRGFELLNLLPPWLALISLPPSEIKTADIFAIYQSLEQQIGEFNFSKSYSRQIFDGTRRFVRLYLQKRPDCPQSSLLQISYPHRAFSMGKPRALISDNALQDGDLRDPVGAMRHTTSSDLRTKIEKRLDGDLRRISDACCARIEHYLSLFEWLSIIQNEPRDIRLAHLLNTAPRRRSADKWRLDLDAFSERELLRELLIRKAESPSFSPNIIAAYVGEDRIMAFVADHQRRVAPKRLSLLLACPLLLSVDFLVSLVILIQIHTAWKVSSVLEMTVDSISLEEGGGFCIKGYKSRTDSITPQAWVLPSDGVLFKGLQMLITRLANLKVMQRVSKDESRLWIGSTRKNILNARIVAGLRRARINLIRDFDLPDFSFEQIRVQCLARISVQRGGLEAARRAADHASIRTTAHYLDQILLERLNTASNLEFQRRLEQNVRFRLADEQWAKTDNSEDMLYSVGDGTACSDPESPPNAFWLQDGLCKGEQCHAAGGCPNRELLLDSDRLEALSLTYKYYENNWRRLAASNIDAFRNIHVPAMLFNIALYGFVSKGPYGHLLRQLEERQRC